MKHVNNIFIAARLNDLSKVKEFIEVLRVQPGATDNHGETAAHVAAREGHVEILKYLIEKDPSVIERKQNYGETLLSLAIKNGKQEIFEYLLDDDPSLIERTQYLGEPLIVLAVRYGKLDMVKYLVDVRKVDIARPLNLGDGDSLSEVAARVGSESIFKYFIEEKGIDVNLKNSLGQPLAFAAAAGDWLQIIEYIIEECHADVTMIDSLGRNILYQSAACGDDELLVPKYLIDQRKLHFDINNVDVYKQTIIHRAAIVHNSIHFLEYFVKEKHANINIPDMEGRTPLHLAASAGAFRVVKFLVEYGANIEVVDGTGKTPLHRTIDENVMRYLKNAKKRVRRGVFEATSSKSKSNVTFHKRIETRTNINNFIQRGLPGTFLGIGNNTHPRPVRVILNSTESFFVLINACLRYLLGSSDQQDKYEALWSPQEIVQNQVDPVALKAIHDSPE